MELNDILTVAIQGGASDIHLKAGLPPMFRVDGALVPLKDAQRLPPEDVGRMAFSIMNAYQRDQFKNESEIDLAYGVPGLGRFRVNVFMQRGAVGIVFRVIPFRILSIEQLNLPKVIETIAQEERGLVLVTGTTGSGKSTTLAAVIDHINTYRTAHIITIEDPIEFLIRDKRSLVNQREVGVDTKSFSRALRSALREDPDVILVGEMRDLETIEIAMTAAETGHLVMSTVHTLDATETITRIVAAFPPFQQKQVRLQLGSILKGVISQRLVPRADGRGRVAAVEIMRCTGRIKELIEDKDRTKEISDAIADGYTSYGMQTFDQSLMMLLTKQLITYEEALRQASNPDDFALRVSGIGGTSDNRWDNFEGATSQGSATAIAARYGGQAAQPSAPAPSHPPAGAPAPVRAMPTQPPQAGYPAAPGSGPTGRAPGHAQAPRPAGPAPVDDDFQIERF
ncbi:MAG: type IV pilus twitching motility protein PilT [Myxococcota bacterium]